MEQFFIERFSKKGSGLCLCEKGRVEIPKTMPGDTVTASLYKKRKGVIRGKLLEVLNPSKDRVLPRCKHSSLCGGCSIQEMDYEAQAKYKEGLVKQTFAKDLVFPIMKAQNPFFYRNKMEFTFSQNRAMSSFLGLMMGKASHFVFNLEECFLCSSWFAASVNAVREWWQKSLLLAFRLQDNSGLLRSLILRESFTTKEKMVILVTADKLPDEALRSFLECFDKDVSVYLRIVKTEKSKRTIISDLHLAGPLDIEEKICGLKFKIGPASFFQPNTEMAEKIYQTALALAPDAKLIFDLYSGTGTLGMLFAAKAKEVISIELNREACFDCRENLKRNDISNLKLYEGDVGEVLKTLSCRPDLIVIDPPRSGLSSRALLEIQKLKPKNILYISCNIETQKRDIDLLGYKVKALQPIDQFPHTHHVENIALLEV